MSKTWTKSQDAIRAKGKFPRKGMKCVILPTEPYTEEVDGKFGKRKMYVVESKEYGKLYVNEYQFLHITEVFNGDYSSGVTVEF